MEIREIYLYLVQYAVYCVNTWCNAWFNVKFKVDLWPTGAIAVVVDLVYYHNNK